MTRSDLLYPVLLSRWSTPVIGLTFLATVAGTLFMWGNGVDSDPLHVLAPADRVRHDSETVAQRLGGSETFELLLPPSGPANVFSMARLNADVSALPGVVGPGDRPRRSESGHQLLTFLLGRGGSTQREATFTRAESLAREAGWDGAAATGLAVRVARDSNDLVRGQHRGILLTVAALWVVMAIGFRSIWLGLLGLIPNILPLILIQGAMGVLGRPLSVASSMIGCVMLGLVVDDTIHLLHAYTSAQGTRLRKLARALHAVKRPILITTTVLCIGFAATIFGELEATREFGALAAATLMIALVADLVLLPALLLRRRPQRLDWKAEGTPCLQSPPTTS